MNLRIWMMGLMDIGTLMYTDITFLLAENLTELQQMLGRLHDAMKSIYLKINQRLLFMLIFGRYLKL